MPGNDFREIAHCGAKFIVTTRRNDRGERQVATKMRSSAPVPSALFGVYVLPEGIPVGLIAIRGIGVPFNPPPHPSCRSVFVASDSEGRFGHLCPGCGGYWRSQGASPRWSLTCPYCGFRSSGHEFLSKAQRAYIERCCELIDQALNSDTDGEKSIDLDAMADTVAAQQKERPRFYSEQGQQTTFTCAACDGWNDILGRFGFCSSCGTRNDLACLEAVVASARAKANSAPDADFASCVRDLVSAFDTMAQQHVEQLLAHVPITERRRARLPKRFHDLSRSAEALEEVFDIPILQSVNPDLVRFAVMMFERRHVYEHKGGEADEKYIDKSGDTSVRPKQIIRETRENVHRLATLIAQLGRNLHEGFHELIPPDPAPIEAKQQADKFRRGPK